MYLTSSVDPSGPKSTKHYILLHHGDRDELLALPKTYSDLEKEVQRLFHIEQGRFHVETDELNLCKGKRIRIPEDAWADIGELLGNLRIVTRPLDLGESNPESAPPVNDSNTVNAPNCETLFKNIVECNPTNSTAILDNLATLRTQNSISGIKWHGQRSNPMVWVDPKWNMNPKTIFVARITYPEKPMADNTTIFFGPRGQPTRDSLRIVIDSANIDFDEFTSRSVTANHNVIKLPSSPQSPGEHTIAFIKHQNKLHIVFDFCRPVVIPNTVTNTWNPCEIFFHMAADRIIDLDVYELEE